MSEEPQWRPLLGITMGDPAGIGPEIAVKALTKADIYETCKPLVIGDYAVLKHAATEIVHCDLDLHRWHEGESFAAAPFTHGSVDVLDIANVDMKSLRHGTISAMSGHACFAYVQTAIRLALSGILDGTVTGPIHKEALQLAGYPFAGHTEIYASLTDTRDYAMMLATGDFRVIHVSTHVSLREAVDRVTPERVSAVIKLAHETLIRMGIQRPRIAVAGLNPHASDGGLFGSEEARVIEPVVRETRSRGIDVEGPLPPDTCFSKARGGQYDIAVAMYHDQGHIPVKMVGFVWNEAERRWSSVSGVNVTLGLPIVRTAVDHGVAFGKAGKGTATEESLVAAIRLAKELCTPRKDR